MLGLVDRTRRVARVIHERATAALPYLDLSAGQLASRVADDFPEHCRASEDQVSFCFDDLPEFTFFVLYSLGDATLFVQSGGRYDGFQLQVTKEKWWTTLHSPIGRRIGARAQRLADCFEDEFGVRNVTKILSRFRDRFR